MKLSLLLGVLVLVLMGCGGDDPPAGEPIPSGPPITVTGFATFDRVPTSATGLNYAGTTVQAIRGAVVEVRTSGGTVVLSRTTTDSFGGFSIQAPSSANLRLVVLAAMGDPAAPSTKVVDNTAGNAVYAVYTNIVTGTGNLIGVNIHAASGWNVSAYTAPRAAAPFAILDVAYDVLAKIRSADAGVTMPALVIQWSPSNTSATIGTSSFSPSTGRISILGDANVDTDEYDDHVIAHEIGHWFEHNFSRSDSIGGPHGDGDILDESVAFGEGFGNAFSGMMLDDAIYRDTIGNQQGTTGLQLNLESDSVSDVAVVGGGDFRLLDGAWSETSVQELLFDLYDSPGFGDTDGDGFTLGFTPIYTVLTGPQRTTTGFTSIHSFLTHLKTTVAVSSVAVDALAAAENVGAYDQFEQTAVGRKRHTVLPSNATVVSVDVDGDPLTTYNTYGSIDGNFSGNKLYNWLYFKATIGTAGSYRLKVVPTNGTHDVIIRRGGGLQPDEVDQVFGGTERLDFTATAGQTVVFAVGSFAVSGNTSGVTPFTIQLGAPVTVGKPEPTDAEEPVIPAGNG